MSGKYGMAHDLWNPKSIGERLRVERRRLGLTQDAFARAGGIRRTALYQYEQGDRRPSLDFLLGCVSVGLDLSFIIFGERKLRPVSEIRLNEEEHARIFALVNTYARDSRGRALAPEHQQELLTQLCRNASDRSEEQVDWDELEATARRFAG